MAKYIHVIALLGLDGWLTLFMSGLVKEDKVLCVGYGGGSMV